MSIRKYLNLVESLYDDDEEEEDDTRYDNLPSSSILKNLRPQMAQAAQAVYDRWEQDEEGYDEEMGHGGICHLIADKIADILSSANVPVSTQCSTYEQHVYCIGQFNDGIFEIDIHWSNYETGGGFTWTKVPNVKFDPVMISIRKLDSDPSRMGQHVEEWEED